MPVEVNHPRDWNRLAADDLGSLLDGIGLYLNQPKLAIICKECKYALQPSGDGISKHLGEKH
jgi:hypothetical protein